MAPDAYTPAPVGPSSQAQRLPRVLFTAAAGVVVVAGLKAASQILLPFLFAIMLAVLALASLRALEGLRVPRYLGTPVVVLAILGGVSGIGAIIAGSIGSFNANVPTYSMKLLALFDDLKPHLDRLDRFGVDTTALQPSSIINPTAVMSLVTSTLRSVGGLASNTFLVVLIMVFVLLEAGSFRPKLEMAFGPGSSASMWMTEAADKIQRYLGIKTVVSLVTGSLAGLWCALLHLDYALLWGLLAFLLNYVPSIGSIIAAVPPTLLALVELGPGGAVAVALGFLGTNVALGNFIEPRLLGQSLGLSPLVVILSLFFWGWVWGPAGMLLSVPLTVIVKIVLESNSETRWIAILLGGGGQVRAELTASLVAIEPVEAPDTSR